MDERHWWIATKIQEAFQVDDTDSPTALEQYLVEPQQFGLMTQFFSQNGINTLFIFGQRPENRAWMQEDLTMSPSLINISNIGLNDFFCVYFLRQSTDIEIEPITMHKEIFCGEIKSNPLHQLSTVLSQVFFPMLKAQKDWQKCQIDQKNQFLHSVEKYVNVLSSATNKGDATKQQILRLPETLVSSDFKQHRISSQFDSNVIREYESAVQDWIQAIDGVLSEGNDERLLDIHSGPLTEVDRWHRRQRVLATITEQLKTKECKNVIGVLIQAKSKLLKKWKAMDLFITDAQNETKDKVKYLEALRRHLEQLHHEDNPAIAVNVILPALVGAIRQMESVSRYYARSGYLGLLCKKICNNLASLCREHVMTIIKPTHHDSLWHVIENEICQPEATPPVFKVMKRGIRRKELVYDDDKTLVSRLKACLSLHTFYRDIIRSMKDTLGGAGSHSMNQSQSSIDTLSARVKKPRGSGTGARPKAILGSLAGPSSIVSGSDGRDFTTFGGFGISMTDEDTIMMHLDVLGNRMKQMLDIIATLRHFSTLSKDTTGLPRPRLEDIPSHEGDDKSSTEMMNSGYGSAHAQYPADSIHDVGDATLAAMKQANFSMYTRAAQSMGPLQEEEEEDEPVTKDKDFVLSSSDIYKGLQRHNNNGRKMSGDDDSDEDKSMDFQTGSSSGSPVQMHFNAALFLRRLYSAEISQGEDGPGLCSIISDHVKTMISCMRGSITTSMLLDVRGKFNDRFEDSFSQFTRLGQDLDQLLTVYLSALFSKSMKTQQCLAILSKFKAVSQRPSMSGVISDRYSDVYSTFSQEIIRIQEMYEEHKDNPITPRDAPQAAGAIYWCKQLLSHIEEPMKIFQENNTLNQSKEYHRAVKLYNRVATALVTCETMWYQQWIKSVDHALSGLRVSLLIPHPTTTELCVNVDQKILNLIHETKWMLRMNLDVPNAAKTVLSREKQFKKYKMHLEQCLYDYKVVCSDIPSPFARVFQPHTDSVLHCLQAGLNSITWDSMNIDAFLHKVRSSTNRLRKIVEKVLLITENRIDKSIAKIASMILFDQKMVFGKTWSMEKLTQEMESHISSGRIKMKEHAQNVENAIQEVIQILSTSRINSADHGSSSFVPPGSKVAAPPAGRKPAASNPRRGTRAGSGSTTTSGTITSSTLAQRYIPEEALIEDILCHYSKKMYESVQKAIRNTLNCLCDGFQIDPNVSVDYTEQHHGVLGLSRPESSSTEEMRPASGMSSASTLSWGSIVVGLSSERDDDVQLKIKVQISFRIPDINLDPPLSRVQMAVDEIVEDIVGAPAGITWWGGPNKHVSYDYQISMDEAISTHRKQLANLTAGLKKRVWSYIGRLSQYNFLWKDDMHRAYTNFMRSNPDISAIRKEVENLLDIEQKISSIPESLPAGCIVLCPGPVMDALQGLAAAWKTQYALVLHEDAKKKLDSVVQYRNNIQNRLSADVSTLDQLNGTLSLIDEVHDMENKIDGVYLPIEKMYEKLKEYNLRLACSELQQVDSLRQNWSELVHLADRLGHTLLKERRTSFEQELDKQLKTFVVEVIQFRNAFDAQGPAIPGVRPAEAVMKLQEFQNRFTLYDAKRKTLDSVQRLFGINPKPFPELDKTGEELKLLGMLYGLFQKFIAFDRRFRDTLWENAGLHPANMEVKGYWDECLSLPDKLKDWDAYTEMKKSIKFYLDVFTLLHRLAEKGKFKDIMIPKIRNRHWLQVMSVTFSKFQLESNIFKLGHLLDIGLLDHSSEIEQICNAANKELELEVKMRGIEEEWTEQVLSFENYKRRGPILLVKEDSERLLELLEDAQALLATMLTSRHIGPLREEAASWAEKLKGVSEVLDTWLETQDLWQELEAVFSDHSTAKELPQEAKRFSMVDKSYVRLMRRAYDTRNIMQCCYGGEVPKDVVLRHMQEELEICFKSLTQYLDKKRALFPRFHFLSDSLLLALLSRPNDLESVRPHLRSVFASIADIKSEKTSSWSETVSSMKSLRNTPTPDSSPILQHHPDAHHRISAIRFKSGLKSVESAHFTPSFTEEALEVLHATAISSTDGETLQLDEEVSLYEGAELWLQNLKDSVSRTLYGLITRAVRDVDKKVPLEEIILNYPVQVGKIALLHLWTKECEEGIAELKWERKAMQNASKKFASSIARLPPIVNRSTWKSGEEPVLPIHRARLENIIYYSVHLRDCLDNLGLRKMRDIGDFEWRRSIRFYSEDNDGIQEHNIHILDNHFTYGLEFYGLSSSANLVIAPATERAFLSMSLSLAQCQGSAVIGNASSGKTETVMGLANLMGRYMTMITCTRSTDSTSLNKILQGLIADGCWGCLDDVHLLPSSGISVMIEISYIIYSKLRKIIDQKTRESSTYEDEGPVNLVYPGSSMFITYNPSAKHFQPLPTAVRSLFRTVSIIKPDMTSILKAKCTALGLRSPKSLAERLKTLAELSYQQLPRPNSTHHEVSLQALLAALNLAAQKRKARDDRSESMSRADTVFGSRTDADAKMSRSNSQTSVRQPPSPVVLNTARGQPSVEKILTKKNAMTNTLTGQAKIDHGLVAQAIMESISPGLNPHETTIFHFILRDTFSGIPMVKELLGNISPTGSNHEIPPHTHLAFRPATSRKKEVVLEPVLTQVAMERGLVPDSRWLSKASQLYQTAEARQGVVLAGPTGSGKSTLMSVLVDSLCKLPHNPSGRTISPGMSNHKLQKLHPMTVDDLSLMFGQTNLAHEWSDGILTYAWRKANRNQSTTWLCLDGPLVTSWADRLNGALSDQKVMQLSNGDRLYLTENMRIVFETSDLNNASPSVLSRTGLVYVDNNVLGWRPLAKAWLEQRNADEQRVLEQAFEKTLDSVCNFVFHDRRIKLPVCEVGLLSTCLTLLGEMLNEHQQHIGGDLHIERLYLFCLVWAFGGLLEGNTVKTFSDQLRQLSSALPDYDHEISVFDYYVDESGEWDTWIARVPEATYTGSTDMLGEVFVDTVDTIRTRCLLDFAHMARKHTLIVGDSGIGKTALVNDFLDTQDKQLSILQRLVFSHASTASQLHTFMQNNIQHRQGFVYGARDGKFLEAFIDDLNLPHRDVDGVQRCNELLRSLIDDQTLCKLDRPFEWRTVEGLEVLATMSVNVNGPEKTLDPRLLRHFAVFRLRSPTAIDTQKVIYSVLEANMSEKPLPSEIHDSLSYASSKLLDQMKLALTASLVPGRHHYAFCLRQVIKMCQCFKRVDEENRSNEPYMFAFWKHEMQRLFGDQLCRLADVAWFERVIEGVTKDYFSHLNSSNDEDDGKKNMDCQPSCFTTFSIESKVHHRPISSQGKDNKVKLYPLAEPRDVYEYLQAHVTHYNEDQHQVTQDSIRRLMLSDDALLHVIKIHRVLSYYYGGSMTIVGAVGSHLSNLTKLALHVAGLQPFKVDASRPAAFFDSLRSAVRIAGTEGVPVVLVLTARELYNPIFLDAINSLLIAGEYPHLFSNDEIEGLLQVLTPILRRSHPNMMSDPMKFFVSQVKCNLHIILNLPPNHHLLRDALHSYPGILSETQIIWIRDWPKEVLIQQAEYFINTENVAKESTPKIREFLTMAIANIHSLTLDDCKQTQWCGDTNPTVTVTSASMQIKKDKETIKVEKYDLPNLPYSKVILFERINSLHRDTSQRAPNEIFIGPHTYRKFMHCLHALYNSTSSKLRLETGCLKDALDTLEETRNDARLMQKAISVLKSQYSAAQVKVKELFTRLTIEATRLEKLKAHLGIGTGPLIAFLKQMQRDDEDDLEDDSLLLSEERDEYDDLFDREMEANLKSKRMKIDEDIVEARKVLDDAKSSLVTAKAQVETWRNKVDRGCIERLKKFQNPPVLVAQVLEMVMVLVGANPYLNPRSDQPSQMGARADTKTPKMSKYDHPAEYESRVSSGSTLKTTRRTTPLNKPTNRRKSTFGASGNKSEGLSAVDRNKWKFMQNFMNDTVRFVEMIHSVNWETGLEPTVLAEIESYLKKGKEGQEGVTGEGSLLDHATSIQAQRKPNVTGITISSARYSSEDAAVLVEYIISIVEYTRLCGPLRLATDKLNSLEIELEQLKRAELDDQKSLVKKDDQEEDWERDAAGAHADVFKETSIDNLSKEDVDKISELVNEIQEKYDNAVVRKHHLKHELQTSKERLRSALATLESLKSLENSWKSELDESVTVEQVLTNCILAAAYLTYCGGMTIDARKRMVSFYTHVCKHYELPLPSKMLFCNLKLEEFILDESEIQSHRIKKLPIDTQALENACILTAGESNMNWCLVCDPSAKIIDWITGYYSQDMSLENQEEHVVVETPELVQVLYKDLRSQFETALSEGQILLVTYCDVDILAKDDRFHQVFRCRSAFLSGSSPFKMMVGDHEVECNPNFRLFLHTASLPQDIPPELAAYTTLVYNQTTRDGIKTELLDRFMRHEKPRLRDEWTNLQIDKSRNMKVLSDLQKQLKEILVGGHRLLNDLNITRKLTDIKKNYDEALEMKAKINSLEESNERAKEGFTDIALRGSVLYQSVMSMYIVNPLYHVSWQRFLGLYDENILQSERSAFKAVCSQMTFNIFSTISKSLLEQDRPIFGLMTALEVEDANGNVNIGEREFLIAPSYSSALMASVGAHASESRAQSKKIFDWMSEEQYHNIQVLGMYFDWFSDSFDRMSKEGREMQWRSLCEADSPEQMSKHKLPDNADSHFTPLQRLLVIRAIRSDRIVQASTEFVTAVLGKRYVRDDPPDISMAIKQSNASTPIILLFTTENNLVTDYMKKYVEAKDTTSIEVIEVVGASATEEKKVTTALAHAMNTGSWLLLHNVQLNKDLVNTVYSTMTQENSSKKKPNSNFRLFLSCSARSTALPDPILHSSIKVVLDHPKGMKDNLLRFFSTVTSNELVTSSNRPEWLPCLHNIALLHGAINLRAKFPINVGWQDPHALREANIEQLKSSLDAVEKEFSDIFVGGSSAASSTIAAFKSVSWSGLRYHIAELTYGNLVTNPVDQLSLNALIDYWLSANSVKKEFELPRVKYRLPSVFFSSNAKQSSIVQALEGPPHHALDCPEGCNLHPTNDGIMGNDQYIFTRLNRIYDSQPESKTLSHKLYPQPPSSLCGPHHTSISSTSSHPWIIHRGVFATHVHAVMKNRKEVELWEICYNALSKIPKTFNKDFVAEKIKKIGGQTPFNLLLQKEMGQMNSLILEIKRSLSSVKNFVENVEHFGGHLTPVDVEVSDALYHGCIPPRWMKLAGDSAPPDATSLSSWMNDLTQRSSHLERILILGRDKMAAYWLGAFFNPHALMAIFKQEAVKNHLDKTGSVDNIVIQTEITQRDKDHLRDPPSEGVFLHGVYLWGCSWEKTTGEMQDTPPKRGPTNLPVLHVTFVLESTKHGAGNDLVRPVDYYGCPVYVTTTSKRKPVFELDVVRESIPSSRWALRGLTATIRPY